MALCQGLDSHLGVVEASEEMVRQRSSRRVEITPCGEVGFLGRACIDFFPPSIVLFRVCAVSFFLDGGLRFNTRFCFLRYKSGSLLVLFASGKGNG